jgi:hypothetical protein
MSTDNYRNRVIVLVDNIDRLAVYALQYAKLISGDITALSLAVDKDMENELHSEWDKMSTGIPYVIRCPQNRGITQLLHEFITSPEYCYTSGDMITVILPQLITNRRRHKFLYNALIKFIDLSLLNDLNIAVTMVPYYLNEELF